MYAPDGDGVMMTHYCRYNQPRCARALGGADRLHVRGRDEPRLPDSPHMDHVTITIGPKDQPEWTYKTGAQAQTIPSRTRVK
jgi:hypothetical protein